MKVRKTLTAGAATLAVCGVLGTVPAAARAGSAAGPGWTQQSPAVHPPARYGAAMTYDGATHTVVLFGGIRRRNSQDHFTASTWTWDGTTWTKQHPAASPPVREDAAMAYDAATHTVVLFGGSTRSRGLQDTWTWNGTTWTEQQPAASPPSSPYPASMAYDAATGTVLLFGGCCTGRHTVFGDTWTWDGTTWTQQHPAVSPFGRNYASMAYDAATSSAVLFGGESIAHGVRADTWTWG